MNTACCHHAGSKNQHDGKIYMYREVQKDIYILSAKLAFYPESQEVRDKKIDAHYSSLMNEVTLNTLTFTSA
jgi:hypothetical protein